MPFSGYPKPPIQYLSPGLSRGVTASIFYKINQFEYVVSHDLLASLAGQKWVICIILKVFLVKTHLDVALDFLDFSQNELWLRLNFSQSEICLRLNLSWITYHSCISYAIISFFLMKMRNLSTPVKLHTQWKTTYISSLMQLLSFVLYLEEVVQVTCCLLQVYILTD